MTPSRHASSDRAAAAEVGTVAAQLTTAGRADAAIAAVAQQAEVSGRPPADALSNLQLKLAARIGSIAEAMHV